jgi:hypothetical protein
MWLVLISYYLFLVQSNDISTSIIIGTEEYQPVIYLKESLRSLELANIDGKIEVFNNDYFN